MLAITCPSGRRKMFVVKNKNNNRFAQRTDRGEITATKKGTTALKSLFL